MYATFKALGAVLGCAWLIFVLAKPVCLRFMAPEDFSRRRAVWFVLTTTAFLSPNFWVYVLVAVPLVMWAAYKDSTPVALFLFFFFVVPPVTIAIPTVLINQLFALSNQRILEFAVLLPAALSRVVAARRGQPLRLNGLDLILLLYGLLQLLLLLPYESSTNTMRRAFLFLLDTYLVYFAFSRLIKDRRDMADVLGALCLAAALFAPMAAYESLRGFLLYTGVSEAWGQANIFAWLFRSEALRAQVATGHSITLGYMLAVAIGFWMYLKETQPSKRTTFAVFALLFVGLFFTYARGPWLTGALVLGIAIVLGSRNAVQMIKITLVPAAIFTAILVSPFGGQFVDLLPFVGSAGAETVDQRRQLAETSWRLVQQNPWFGNPFVLLDMEELRTGDNIIDLVNGYSQVALFYGLVGLALFMAVYLGALRKAYTTFKISRAVGDVELVWLGASLIACMVSSLFLMATSGQLYWQWVSAGLLVSYAGLQVAASPVVVAAVVRDGSLRSRRAAPL
jgi:hypothetical protein